MTYCEFLDDALDALDGQVLKREHRLGALGRGAVSPGAKDDECSDFRGISHRELPGSVGSRRRFGSRTG